MANLILCLCCGRVPASVNNCKGIYRQALCTLETIQHGHFEFLDAIREITQMGLPEEIFSIHSGLDQLQCCTKADQQGNPSF